MGPTPTAAAGSPPNKRRVILVHGFNVADGGAGTVDQLRPYFERLGFDVVDFDYGWLFLLRARFETGKLARRLAAMIQPGDIGVGHSHGCNLLNEAAWLGAKFAQLVYINAALDSDAALAPHVERLHVWHSPSDRPLWFAKLLLFHNWGDMGAVGYRGRYDPRIASYNKENGFPVSSREHSDVFKPDLVKFFGPRIAGEVVATLSP